MCFFPNQQTGGEGAGGARADSFPIVHDDLGDSPWDPGLVNALSGVRVYDVSPPFTNPIGGVGVQPAIPEGRAECS